MMHDHMIEPHHGDDVTVDRKKKKVETTRSILRSMALNGLKASGQDKHLQNR